MKHPVTFALLSFMLVLSVAASDAHGATLVWTNTSGGSWIVAENWDPNGMPGPGDTAVITNAGDYKINADAGGTFAGLILGAGSGTQTLVLDQNEFNCNGTLSVNNGAILQLNAGYFQAEQLVLAGTMNWEGGLVGGPVTVASNGVLNISGDALKTLAPGAALTNYGLVRWSGLGGLVGQDDPYGPGHPVIANMPGGVVEISNDSVLRLDSWTSDPNLAFLFVNAGTLRKVAGPGTTIFGGLQFFNTGAVEVQQGTLQFLNSGGGSVTSAGLFTVAAGAAVDFDGGSCTLLPGHQTQGEGLFGLGAMDMPLALQGQFSGRFDWSGGVLLGQLTVASNGVLNINGDALKTLAPGAALTNYGLVRWSGLGGLVGQDDPYGPGHPVIANMPGGVVEISNDSVLQIDSWVSDPNLAFLFFNAGTLRKLAGSGTTLFNGVKFCNTGTLELWSGSLELGSPFSYNTQWEDSGLIRLAVLGPTNFTRIQSFGPADLTGQLEMVFQNGYLPAPGDSFELLTYASTNVAFNDIHLPDVPEGLYLAVLVESTHVVVAVRQDPIANHDSFTVQENTPADLDVLANDSNMYGGAIINFTQPSHGLLSLNPDNTLHYIPTPYYSGFDSFGYQARNADGKLASAEVTLQILHVNHAPTLAPLADQTIDAMRRLTFTAQASDVDGDQLTFRLGPAPLGAYIHPVTGAFSWTPSELWGGRVCPITVTVTDNGTPNLSASRTFTVTVRELNRAPLLDPISDQTVAPAQTLSLTFSAVDLDWPRNTVTFSLDTAPDGAALTPNGQFTWTPSFDQIGTNIVVVRATYSGTPPLSSTQGFSIIVLNSGLKADYFSGTNFDNLVITRNDLQVNFDWAPDPRVQFSVRWTGQVVPRYSETYTFYTVSDDGVRLWVDGQPIINNWTVHPATTNTGIITLTAGQPYMFRLEYFSASPGAGAVSRLLWSSTSQPEEIVPGSQLLCSGYSDLIPKAVYRFTPKLATGRCMDAASGGTAEETTVDLRDWKAASYQQWQAVPMGSNYFKLISQHALDKVLDLKDGYTNNGTKLQIATDNGTSSQQFQVVNMGQGWFKIQPRPAPGSVLDLKNGDTGNNAAVVLNQDLGTDSQRWRLDRQ